MRRDLQELGDELRTARLAAGLTLREVGQRLGVAPSVVLGNERAQAPGGRPELLGRHAAAVGLRARLKAYPDGDPLRDTASVALIGAFKPHVPRTVPFRLEVPVDDQPGDLRAWDAVLYLPTCTCALEFVTRFHDCQAQLRAFHLKQRDGKVDRLFVIVKATNTNRRALAFAREIVATDFPLGTRAVMAALKAGRDPGANGIVLLAAPKR